MKIKEKENITHLMNLKKNKFDCRLISDINIGKNYVILSTHPE